MKSSFFFSFVVSTKILYVQIPPIFYVVSFPVIWREQFLKWKVWNQDWNPGLSKRFSLQVLLEKYIIDTEINVKFHVNC